MPDPETLGMKIRGVTLALVFGTWIVVGMCLWAAGAGITKLIKG